MHGNVGEHELNRRRIFKNTPPAFHHRVPTAQEVPTGMTALDFRVLGPDRFHPLDVETFESPVEAFVGLSDCFFFRGHKYLMMRFRRNEHQSHQLCLAAIGDAVILSRGSERDLAGAELSFFICRR